MKKRAVLPWAFLILSAAIGLEATVLTFQIYEDAAKATLAADPYYGYFEPHDRYSYGDNVTNFDDATPHGLWYFTYGSGGGATPTITVVYNDLDNWGTAMNTYPSPGYGDFGSSGLGWVYGFRWTVTYPGRYRFAPATNRAVAIHSFDLGSYGQVLRQSLNATLAVIQDFSGPGTGTVLWGGISNQTVTAAATHTSYLPAVTGAIGSSLCLVWDFGGNNGNIAFSNIQFAEAEPALERSALILLR